MNNRIIIVTIDEYHKVVERVNEGDWWDHRIRDRWIDSCKKEVLWEGRSWESRRVRWMMYWRVERD